MINKFSIYQPNGWDNSITPTAMIHKLINEVNSLIDVINAIEEVDHSYTDGKIDELKAYVDEKDLDLTSSINAVETHIVEVQNTLSTIIATNNTNRIADITRLENSLTNLTTSVSNLAAQVDDNYETLTNLVTINNNLLSARITLLEDLINNKAFDDLTINDVMSGKFVSLRQALFNIFNINRKNSGNMISFERLKIAYDDSYTDKYGTVYNTNNNTVRRYTYPIARNSQSSGSDLTFTINAYKHSTMGNNYTALYVMDKDGELTLSTGSNQFNAQTFGLSFKDITFKDRKDLTELFRKFDEPTYNVIRNWHFYKKFTSAYNNANTWSLPLVYKHNGVINNSAAYFFLMMKLVFQLKRLFVKSVKTNANNQSETHEFYYSLYDIIMSYHSTSGGYAPTVKDAEWCCTKYTVDAVTGEYSFSDVEFTQSQINTIVNGYITELNSANYGGMDVNFFNAFSFVNNNQVLEPSQYQFTDFGNILI